MIGRKKSNSGSILPLTTYSDGKTEFDPDAGIVGMVKRAFTAPGRAWQGQIPEGKMIEEAQNVTGLMGTGSLPGLARTGAAAASAPALGTFFGKASAVARSPLNKARFATAERDLAAGLSPEDVWQRHMVMRDPKGRMWMEQSDADLRFMQQENPWGDNFAMASKKRGMEHDMVDGRPEGKDLRISTAFFDPSNQGKGIGQRMYTSLANQAHANGGVLKSDDTVSIFAQRMYDKLKARGYGIDRNPNATKGPIGNELLAPPGQSVFTVYPPKDPVDLGLAQAQHSRMRMTQEQLRQNPPWIKHKALGTPTTHPLGMVP